MKPVSGMTPDEILREVFAERRRREGLPSSAGINPDSPKGRRVPSGRHEDLILLTMGCDKAMIEAMYAASSLYQLGGDRCHVGGCNQAVLHEHRNVLGDDGKPLLSQGEPITEPVAVAVHPSAVALQHGIPLEDVKRRIGAVLNQVAENQGRRRGAAREDGNDYEEDVAIEAWRLWCARGGM